MSLKSPGAKKVIAAFEQAVKKHRRTKGCCFDFAVIAKELGFKAEWHAGASRRPIYISKKLGLVVKRPYVSEERDLYRKSKYKIPTHIIDVKDEVDRESDSPSPIYIQPLADVSKKAVKIALETFDGVKHGFYDDHDKNIGLYNGKPVIFDW